MHHHTTVVAPSPFGFGGFGMPFFGGFGYRPIFFAPIGGLLSTMLMLLAAGFVFSFVRVSVSFARGRPCCCRSLGRNAEWSGPHGVCSERDVQRDADSTAVPKQTPQC